MDEHRFDFYVDDILYGSKLELETCFMIMRALTEKWYNEKIFSFRIERIGA